MTYDVFISFANNDAQTANAICRHLEQQELKCWIAPRDIEPGVNWAEAIVDVIPKVKIFLLVFSEQSNMSKQVIREVELAIKSEAVIIPVRIENVQPTKSMAYYLSSVQWMNANQPLTDHQLDSIYNTVRKNLEKKPSIISAEPNKSLLHPRRKQIIWAVSAAVIVLLIAAGSAWYFGLFSGGKKQAAQTPPEITAVAEAESAQEGTTEPAEEATAPAAQESSAKKIIEVEFDSTDDLKWFGVKDEHPMLQISSEGYLDIKNGEMGNPVFEVANGDILHCRIKSDCGSAVTLEQFCVGFDPSQLVNFYVNGIGKDGQEKGSTGGLMMNGVPFFNEEQWIDCLLSVSEDGSIIYAVASDPSAPESVVYTAYILPEEIRKSQFRPSFRVFKTDVAQYFYVDYMAVIRGAFIDYLKEVLPGYDQYEEELTALLTETPENLPPIYDNY